MTINVTLLRHGETVDNVNRRIQGHRNSLLSETGRLQAQIVGKRLALEKFTRIYSSDLSRAFETSEIILKHSKVSQPAIISDRRLRERCYGVLEGHHVSVALEEAKRLGIHIHDLVPSQAESMIDVQLRVKEFLEEVLLNIDENSDDENILVVSHGAWLLNFMTYLHSHPGFCTLLNFNVAKGLTIPRNTGLTKIQIEPPLQKDEPYQITFKYLHDMTHLNNSTVQSSTNDGV